MIRDMSFFHPEFMAHLTFSDIVLVLVASVFGLSFTAIVVGIAIMVWRDLLRL